MHTPIDAAHSPIVRAAVEGTLHGWQRLSRFQAAIAYPTMKAAATALGLHVTALTVEIQRLESDTSGRLYHRAVHAKPQRPTRHGQTLLAALEEPCTAAALRDATAAALRDATGPAPQPPDRAALDTIRAELFTRSPAAARGIPRHRCPATTPNRGDSRRGGLPRRPRRPRRVGIPRRERPRPAPRHHLPNPGTTPTKTAGPRAATKARPNGPTVQHTGAANGDGATTG